MSLKIEIDTKQILGRGAYGYVFKGSWNGKEVAVKRVQLLDLEEIIHDRELSALQRFDHSNVINLLCVQDDAHFRLNSFC